ncbi:hypothetical protein pb186bvf_017065, partial [Paramecium bursaria]
LLGAFLYNNFQCLSAQSIKKLIQYIGYTETKQICQQILINIHVSFEKASKQLTTKIFSKLIVNKINMINCDNAALDQIMTISCVNRGAIILKF